MPAHGKGLDLGSDSVGWRLRSDAVRVCFVLTLFLAPIAQGATIPNASFEEPGIVPEWVNVNGGSIQIAGWTVVQNNVDIVRSGFRGTIAAHGNQWIDLNGDAGAGAIQTTISGLTVGQVHQLSFEFSNFPLFPWNEPKTFDVAVADVNKSFVTSGGAQVWQPGYVLFTPDAPSVVLTVTSTHPSNLVSGAFVDNFAIGPIPEPSTLILVVAGLAALASLRRTGRSR